MAPRRTILQAGRQLDCDLVMYAHIDPTAVKACIAATTEDCAVVEFWGEGTSAYRPMLQAYGGSWRSYVSGLEKKLHKDLNRTCLTTWSAGSQVAKDVAQCNETPDAIVLLDGLYGSKPAGSKPGDGKIVMDPGLTALAAYAVQAARGQKVMVIVHSNIQTPYGSSKECAEAIQAVVERELRAALPDADKRILGREAVQAISVGSLHILEYAGRTAEEHILQAHQYDEAWRAFVPWLVEPDADATPTSTPNVAAEVSLPLLALQVALEEQRANVRENPPGSNQIKAAYWAGCTRVNPKTGREDLIKLTKGPWCASGFQWCSYEAARRMGLMCPEDFTEGPVPHGRRVSVIEIQHDFERHDRFHAAADVRAGRFEPLPGDAVFLDRPSGTPGQDWIGHIARFVRRIDADTFETIGGNEAPTSDADHGDAWRTTTRRFADKRLRGFGAFPRTSPVALPEKPATLPAWIDGQVALALDRATREWIDASKGRPT